MQILTDKVEQMPIHFETELKKRDLDIELRLKTNDLK